MNSTENEIPFILYDDSTKKLEINHKAIEILSNFEDKIYILSIIGLINSGKSFLLNKIIGNNNFIINSHNKLKQSGIYISGPITYENENNKQFIFALDLQYFQENKTPIKIKLIFEMILILISSKILCNFNNYDEIISFFENMNKLTNNIMNISFNEVSFYFITKNEDNSIQKKLKEFFQKNEKKINFFKFMNRFNLKSLSTIKNLQNNDDQSTKTYLKEITKLKEEILNEMEPKKLNNCLLKGSQFSDYILLLLNEINENKTIDFEKLFNDITKLECEQACKESLELYDISFQENVLSILPMSIEDLKKIHKNLKESSIELFKEKKLGNDFSDYLSFLLNNFKEKFNYIISFNEKESIKKCMSFINEEFKYIENKIKNKDYDKFDDFQNELIIFKDFYIDNIPDYPNKKIIILEFIIRKLIEGVKQLFNLYQINQSDIISEKDNFLSPGNISKESVIQQKSVKELSVENDSLLKEKNNLEKEISFLKNEFESKKTEKKIIDQEIKASIDLKLKCNDYESDNLKLKDRENILNISEYKKEIALLTQKNSHLEFSLEELTQTNKRHSSELKSFKKDHYNEIKDLTLKYETINKTLELNIKELKDKIYDYENEIQLGQKTLTQQRQKLEISENHYKSILKENEIIIKQLEKDLLETRTNFEKSFLNQKEEFEKSLSSLTSSLKIYEENIQSKEKTFKELKMIAEKDKAIYEQKIEFLDLELKELKEKSNETNNLQDAFLKAIELNNDFSSPKEKVKNDLFENLKKETKKLETENNHLKNKLNGKNNYQSKNIEELENKNNELYKEIEILKKELDRKDLECETIILNERQEINKSKKLAEIKEFNNFENYNNSTMSSNSFFDRDLKGILKKNEENLKSDKIILLNHKLIDQKKLIEELFDENKQLSSELKILSEKLRAKKEKKSKLLAEFSSQINHLNKQITNLQYENRSFQEKEQANIDFFNKKTEELLESKEALESSLFDLQNLYEQDKSLWEAKINFLENQHSQSCREWSESRRNFEQALLHFQQINQQKEDNVETQVAMIQAVEKKTEMKIEEITEYYERKLKENEKKTLLLENQNKEIIEIKKEFAEKERKLNWEIQMLKKSNEIIDKSDLILSSIDFEKENLKNTIYELEKQIKEYEKQLNIQSKKTVDKKLMYFENKKNKINKIQTSLDKLNFGSKENDNNQKDWKAIHKSINIYSTRNLEGESVLNKIKSPSQNHLKKNSLIERFDRNNQISFNSNELNKSYLVIGKTNRDENDLFCESRKKY